ncbi:unnamed protein product [Symbiodinium sp. CCMP2592]|nr:unnamed protein product [Symbiodinium sp. CCMP2592]
MTGCFGSAKRFCDGRLVFSLVLRCLALAVVALQVFSTRIQKMLQADAKDFLMDCDPAIIGLSQSYVCEATKAFVRCFPPVSIVVALMVASQLILCQRLFYLMIRHKVLVDFQNLAPYKDPMFWWVIITCVLALSHFIFHMLCVEKMHAEHHNLQALLDGLKKDAVFFGLPAIFYIIFLYMSYDVEWLLLPLSKFWEEDPVWAQEVSSDLAFITENVARRTVLHGSSETALTVEDIAESLSVSAQQVPESETNDSRVGLLPRSSSRKPAGWISEQRQQRLQKTGKSSGKIGLGQFRSGLITRSWIADLLLDYRLVDAKSREFRLAWILWVCIICLACLAAVTLLALQIAKDVQDIIRGQHADIVGTVVTSVNVLCMIAVVLRYLYEADTIVKSGWSVPMQERSASDPGRSVPFNAVQMLRQGMIRQPMFNCPATAPKLQARNTVGTTSESRRSQDSTETTTGCKSLRKRSNRESGSE